MFHVFYARAPVFLQFGPHSDELFWGHFANRKELLNDCRPGWQQQWVQGNPSRVGFCG